jgi:pimeloyl-ACP methyl ester carboxylesterase
MRGLSLSLVLLLLAGCNDASNAPADLAVAPDLSPLPPLTTPLACSDTLSSVYETPSSLPPFTAAERGRIVRCAMDTTLTAADVQRRAHSAGYAGDPLTSGAQALRIAYRTERLAGQPGLAVAEVYLPSLPTHQPAAAAVAAHGTIGLADLCAPTMLGGIGSDSMAMPLVGRGVATIAPDYAGLGNGAGTTWHGYDIAEDEAHSTLDAARALYAAAPAGSLTTAVVLFGHSQGGGSVLASQALAKGYAPELEIAGVVGFAPGWYDRRSWIAATKASNRGLSTGGTLTGLTAFGAMYFFAHAAVYDGLGSAADPFAAAVRSGVSSAMGSECINTLGGVLAQLAPTFGDLYDNAFGDALDQCNTGGACTATATEWLRRMDADQPALDPNGAPVLLVQGLNDTTITPQATACAQKKITADGAKVTACTDASADHMTIPGRQAALAGAWLEARVFGAAEPTCDSALPACP